MKRTTFWPIYPKKKEGLEECAKIRLLYMISHDHARMKTVLSRRGSATEPLAFDWRDFHH